MEEWRQVKEIFGDALELALENRASFLDKICGDNKSLRCEVESLIATSENDSHFMESAAIGKAAEIFDEVESKMAIRKSFNHCGIIKQIGAGGMCKLAFGSDVYMLFWANARKR